MQFLQLYAKPMNSCTTTVCRLFFILAKFTSPVMTRCAKTKKVFDCTLRAVSNLKEMKRKMKTLKEICSELGVSRRAVQGYQVAGLVKATRKNKYGHLLYNQKAIEKIQYIKFLQDMGFSIKKIKVLLDEPSELVAVEIEKQIEVLEIEIEDKKLIIQNAKQMLRELEAKK